MAKNNSRMINWHFSGFKIQINYEKLRADVGAFFFAAVFTWIVFVVGRRIITAGIVLEPCKKKQNPK